MGEVAVGGGAVAGGTTPAPGPAALGYRPGLDGLRALALLAVMAFHHGQPAARGGYLGVSSFFTLSGFLITTLALAEWRRAGALSWRAFWERRARRLLPAALVTLAGVVAIQVRFGIGAGPRFRGDVLAGLAYVTNWRLAAGGDGYAALFAAPSPVTHLWSLAIEEQFYLLFPAVFVAVVAVARGRMRRAAAVAGLAALAAFALAWTSAGRAGNDGVTYYGTHTRAGELLVGVALAFVLAAPGAQRAFAPRPVRAVLAVAAVAALGALGTLWHAVAIGDPHLFRGVTAANAGLTAVVVAAVARAGALDRALGVTPLRLVGKVSYGAYLYHWPLFLVIAPPRTGLTGIPLFGARLTVTLAAAALSYAVIEAPFRFRLRVPRPRLALALGTGAALVAVLVAEAPLRPAAFADLAGPAGGPAGGPVPGVAAAAADGGAGDAAPPDGHRMLGAITPRDGSPATDTVFLAGDSVSDSILPGFLFWNEQPVRPARTFRVDTHVAFGCPVGGPGRMRDTVERETFPDCTVWHGELAGDLAASAPDVIVFVMGLADLRGREIGGRWREMGDAVHDRWLRDRIDELATTLEAPGVPVLWLTFPHIRARDPDDPTRRWEDIELNDPARVDRLNELAAEALADHPGVTTIDLDGWLATWPNGSFDPADRDGVHFSFAAADRVVRWLVPQITAAVDRAAPPPPPPPLPSPSPSPPS
ncbi:MAG TPA: acyltransferase family protein [Acidimicrobiales bacterium]|nr:acyltransferase family protein [Acidimicrobiales bacterium]